MKSIVADRAGTGTDPEPAARTAEISFALSDAPPEAPEAPGGPAAVPWRPLLEPSCTGGNGPLPPLPDHPAELSRPAWLADAVSAPEAPDPVRIPEACLREGTLSRAQAEAAALAMQAFRRKRLPAPGGRKDGPSLFVLADAAGAGRRRTAAAAVAMAWLEPKRPSRRVIWISACPRAAALAGGSLRTIGAEGIPVMDAQGDGRLQEGSLPEEGVVVVSPELSGKAAARVALRLGRWASLPWGRPAMIVAEGLERPPEAQAPHGIWSLLGSTDGARVLAMADVAGPAATKESMARGLPRALLPLCPEEGGWLSSGELADAVGELSEGCGEAFMRSLAAEGALECRMPSLEGVPVRLETVPLEDSHRELHRLWSGVWLRIAKGLSDAIDRARQEEGSAHLRLQSLADGAQREMFRHLPSAFVARRVAEAVRESVSRGEAPVVRILEHCGASLRRRAQEAKGGTLTMHACSGPAEDFAQLLWVCMQTTQMTPKAARDGKVTMQEATDDDGSPVSSPYAVSRRGRAVAACRDAEPLLPSADAVREAAGVPVAECTGRTLRTKPDGRGGRRSVPRSHLAEGSEAARFSSGDMPALIVSGLGTKGERPLPRAPEGRPVRLILAGADDLPGRSAQAAMAAAGMGKQLAGVDIVVPDTPLESRLASDAAGALAAHGAKADPFPDDGGRSAPPFGSPPMTKALQETAYLASWLGDSFAQLPAEEVAVRVAAVPGPQDRWESRPELFLSVASALPLEGQAKALEGLDARAGAMAPEYRRAGRLLRTVGTVDTPFEASLSVPLPGLPDARILELKARDLPLPDALRPNRDRMAFSVQEASQIVLRDRSDSMWTVVPEGGGSPALAIRLDPPKRRGAEAPWLVTGPDSAPRLVLSAGPPDGSDGGNPPERIVQSADEMAMDGWTETRVQVERLASAWSGEGAGKGGEGTVFLLCGRILPLMRLAAQPPARSLAKANGGLGVVAVQRTLRILRVRGAGSEGERPVHGIPLDPAGLALAFLLARSPEG